MQFTIEKKKSMAWPESEPTIAKLAASDPKTICCFLTNAKDKWSPMLQTRLASALSCSKFLPYICAVVADLEAWKTLLYFFFPPNLPYFKPQTQVAFREMHKSLALSLVGLPGSVRMLLDNLSGASQLFRFVLTSPHAEVKTKLMEGLSDYHFAILAAHMQQGGERGQVAVIIIKAYSFHALAGVDVAAKHRWLLAKKYVERTLCSDSVSEGVAVEVLRRGIFLAGEPIHPKARCALESVPDNDQRYAQAMLSLTHRP